MSKWRSNWKYCACQQRWFLATFDIWIEVLQEELTSLKKATLRRTVSQILRIEIDNGNRDIVSEHSYDVLGQREQLRNFWVVQTKLGAAQSVTDDVRGRVRIPRFRFESFFALEEHFVDFAQRHVLLGKR